MESPYDNKPETEWKKITIELIKDYPIKQEEIVEVVLKSWELILNTKLGNILEIGKDIQPSPQVMGNLLHEMIPAVLANNHPDTWKKGEKKKEKDLVYISNDVYSTEIKTSSNSNNIYANASYGIEDSSSNASKDKNGFYLCVNFEKFDTQNTDFTPSIKKIRLGWIDHEDWHSQRASSGQQATIRAKTRDSKLIVLYEKS